MPFPDGADLLLHAAVAFAAFCQSVTGIGFGLIAGPVLIVVIGDASAILVSTLMSWLIAALLFPLLWRGTKRALLWRFSGGALLGLPLGLWLLAVSGIELLKLLAGAAVGLLTLLLIFGAPGIGHPGRGRDLVCGALGGSLGGCLAMPGPPPAVRLAALGHRKVAVRATMVSFFVVVWPIVFLGQALATGLSGETLWTAAALVPATVAGLVAGNAVAAHVSERLFRRGVLAFLLATSGSLLGQSLWRHFSG